MLHRTPIHLISAVIGLLSITATAQDDKDYRLPVQITAGDSQLQLCGEVALRAVLGIFKYGYGGLYLSKCADYENITGDVPKQWSVLLTRNADGETLTDIAEESLEDNFNDEQLAALDNTFSCITSAYTDTSKGGQIDVRYLPGTGLQLWRNEELSADCGGGAGAAEYFRIWFGDDPFNDSLKEDILEQAAAASESTR